MSRLSEIALPLRIEENLLSRLADFGGEMIAVYLGLCQHAYGAAEVPSDEAKARAVADLAFLNQALSSLGALEETDDANSLLRSAFTPGRRWGRFQCESRPLFDSIPDGRRYIVIVSGDQELPEIWARGLFGMAALNQLSASGECSCLAVAAEMIVSCYMLAVSDISVTAAKQSSELTKRIHDLELQVARAKGAKTQTDRKAKVVQFARKLAGDRASDFHNKTHAARVIQAEVRAYARKIGHPLGEREQTIADMLKGIEFGSGR